VTEDRFRVLAVCTANICRSPMIEILLRANLSPERFEVGSAGVRGFDGAPMDGMSAMELLRLGQSADAFASRPISTYLVDSSDLILTATRAHRSSVLSLNPLALRRTFTLVEFAALAALVEAEEELPEGRDGLRAMVAAAARQRTRAPSEVDIDDPYRRSPEVHRRTADQIAEAVQAVAGSLRRLEPQPG